MPDKGFRDEDPGAPLAVAFVALAFAGRDAFEEVLALPVLAGAFMADFMSALAFPLLLAFLLLTVVAAPSDDSDAGGWDGSLSA